MEGLYWHAWHTALQRNSCSVSWVLMHGILNWEISAVAAAVRLRLARARCRHTADLCLTILTLFKPVESTSELDACSRSASLRSFADQTARWWLTFKLSMSLRRILYHFSNIVQHSCASISKLWNTILLLTSSSPSPALQQQSLAWPTVTKTRLDPPLYLRYSDKCGPGKIFIMSSSHSKNILQVLPRREVLFRCGWTAEKVVQEFFM